MTRPGPVERIRTRVAEQLGPSVAARLPEGYQRLGRVLVVRLDASLRGSFAAIGAAYAAELRVGAVLRRRGTIGGDWRLPDVEVIHGVDTETEVLEHGIRYRFDAARLMFAEGNAEERARAGALVRPGETVADLFAGIGYFAVPAARAGRARRVYACEENPLAHHYLVENAQRNHVADRVTPILGDNRTAEMPAGGVDRVFLGLLPSSVPYLDRALELLPPEGGWLHVHLVAGTREGTEGALAAVGEGLDRAGGEVLEGTAREVKAYGPGRFHAVADVRARRAG